MNKSLGDEPRPLAGPFVELDGAGWALMRDSYGFHRSFHGHLGRPSQLGEFTRLARQVRSGEAVRITLTAWQVVADTGESVTLLIRGKGRYVQPAFILPAEWRPATENPPAAVPEVVPAAPAPAPGRRLTLGSKTAAMALEARLRTAGISA